MSKISGLEKLGLNKKEAKAYISCLELGSGSVLDIAKKAGLPTSTASDTLNSLIKRGLIHVYVKKSRKRYTATDPEIFNKKVSEYKRAADEVIPELQAIHNYSSTKPGVRFYEGEAGIKTVLDEILDEADLVLGINSAKEVFDALPKYFPWFPEERTKRGIPIKLIFSDSPLARERKKIEKKLLRETKIIKVDLPFDAMVFIWNNKTAFVTIKRNFTTVVIEDKEIVKAHRAFFDLMWKYVPTVT